MWWPYYTIAGRWLVTTDEGCRRGLLGIANDVFYDSILSVDPPAKRLAPELVASQPPRSMVGESKLQ